ncbi:MAG TPA: lipopolysaccharide heptosyltransferase I [Gammaproteobacteria bacterium]|nr:lipopolysaccharide heptosyltransferase I [Gammaproteobacteria bacterium]
MRVLIIKTSSMGDIIHTLPALTDAGKAVPGIRFDWVVEENFAEIPGWHPLVENVVPVAIRRWRKNIFAARTHREVRKLYSLLRAAQYDLIIDAQGLFKSLWIAGIAKGPLCGLDRHSAREPLTSLFYSRKYSACWDWHAVTRLRSLFSQALHYPFVENAADYGIDRKIFRDHQDQPEASKYLVFLHGTTWATKHWPEKYWMELAGIANEKGWHIKLPWGNEEEKKRALRIAVACENACVLPRLNLIEITKILAEAEAVVAVDTGLAHLAAALNVPTVSVYGSTDAVLTGTLGESQIHLSAKFSCAPCLSRECTYRGAEKDLANPACFSTVSPMQVWNALISFNELYKT